MDGTELCGDEDGEPGIEWEREPGKFDLFRLDSGMSESSELIEAKTFEFSLADNEIWVCLKIG